LQLQTLLLLLLVVVVVVVVLMLHQLAMNKVLHLHLLLMRKSPMSIMRHDDTPAETLPRNRRGSMGQ
jgi:hypothetical protein